jgi:hypothetical protein
VGSSLQAFPGSNGGDIDTYTITPTLPLGLGLNAGTGVIFGTPVIPTLPNTFTVTARNGQGFTTATVNITIKVAAPTDLQYTEAAQE